MILLADNDIIGKLAACDLLDAALEVLATTRQEVFVLGTARYVLGVAGKQRKRASRFDPTTVDRIRAFLDAVQVLSGDSAGAEFALLNAVPGIDPGEAILYSATANYKEFFLATGDRRSLQALVAAGNCDTGLRALFGSGMDATEANVMEGLASDSQLLIQEVGDLVVRE